MQNLRAECAYEHLVKFRSIHPQLLDLCRRIDALDHVVARACIDLTNLETAVETAENELGKCSTVSDRLFGILNPLSLFVSEISLLIIELSMIPYDVFWFNSNLILFFCRNQEILKVQ